MPMYRIKRKLGRSLAAESLKLSTSRLTSIFREDNLATVSAAEKVKTNSSKDKHWESK